MCQRVEITIQEAFITMSNQSNYAHEKFGMYQGKFQKLKYGIHLYTNSRLINLKQGIGKCVLNTFYKFEPYVEAT